MSFRSTNNTIVCRFDFCLSICTNTVSQCEIKSYLIWKPNYVVFVSQQMLVIAKLKDTFVITIAKWASIQPDSVPCALLLQKCSKRMNEYCGTAKNYNRLTHRKNVTDQCIESSRPIVWCRQFFWCVPHMTRYRDIGHVETPGLLTCEQWDDQNSMARSCPGWSIPRAMWTVFCWKSLKLEKLKQRIHQNYTGFDEEVSSCKIA